MKFNRDEILNIFRDYILREHITDEELLEYDSAFFDSRECIQSSIFVALDGETTSGINYISDAISRGALCVVSDVKYYDSISKVMENNKGKVDFLFVDNPLYFFGLLGQYAREKYPGIVLGIIGSVGKTTTKNMLRELLGGDCVHASHGSYNNQTGVPLTLCSLPISARAGVVEMGESHFGDLTYITAFTQPDILVITNVENAHTEHLGDTYGVARTMNESVVLMRDSGVVIAPSALCHADIVLSGNMATLICVIDDTRGGSEEDLLAHEYAHITNIYQRKDYTHDVTIVFRDHKLTVHIPLIGEHFVLNASLAIVASIVAGEDPTNFAARMECVVPQGHRMRYIETPFIGIIDDCYNANPASMKASMEAVAHIARSHNSRSVFFMGPMRELGERSDVFHQELSVHAAQMGIDVLVCVGIETESASAEGIHPNCFYYPSVKECCDHLEETVSKGDVVGVKASRGPNPDEPFLFPIVKALSIIFEPFIDGQSN